MMAAPDSSAINPHYCRSLLLDSSAGAALHAAAAALHKCCSNAPCPESFADRSLCHFWRTRTYSNVYQIDALCMSAPKRVLASAGEQHLVDL